MTCNRIACACDGSCRSAMDANQLLKLLTPINALIGAASSADSLRPFSNIDNWVDSLLEKTKAAREATDQLAGEVLALINIQQVQSTPNIEPICRGVLPTERVLELMRGGVVQALGAATYGSAVEAIDAMCEGALRALSREAVQVKREVEYKGDLGI